MSGRSHPALAGLRAYVGSPAKQPYFIAEAPGEEPLTSSTILEVITSQALVGIERTALDIGQVLMRTSYEKSISSIRNLVKEIRARYERRAQLALLLPDDAPMSRPADGDVPWNDEVLKMMIAVLQDSDGEHSSTELGEQTSRHNMTPMAHGEYVLVLYDALTGDFVSELVGLFSSLLDRHDADDGIRPILSEVVLQHRANLRAYLRRYGVWV